LNLSILKAQRFVNHLAKTKNFDLPFYYLDSQSYDCFVVDPMLVDQIIKSEYVIPFDIWNYYLNILKKNPSDFKYLTDYFCNGPLLKSGPQHHEIRKKMARYYQAIEMYLDNWSPKKINEMSQTETLITNEKFVDIYCDEFFSKIVTSFIQNGYSQNSEHAQIFRIFPNAEDLQVVNEQLKKIFESASSDAKIFKEQFWLISSVLIMGNDALRSALTYALDQKIVPKDTTMLEIASWYEKIAPVSLIVRKVLSDCKVDEYELKRGASIYYSPYLSHIASKGIERGGYAFGRGPHLCPGRSIALKAAAIFFNEYYMRSSSCDEYPNKVVDKIWRRRLVLERLDVRDK